MEHTRTTPQQSVILKKIGYDVPTTKFYTVSNGDTMYTADTFNHNLRELAMSAPNLTDVATWLRKEHGWHVAVISTNKNKFWLFIVTDCEGFEYHYGKADDENTFSTHDLALSAGIDFILTKLNEDETHSTSQNSRNSG
jgi:hypothetical protein